MTAKLAHEPILFPHVDIEGICYFICLWEWNRTIKLKVFCWNYLENKLLTWDNFVKRGGMVLIFVCCA